MLQGVILNNILGLVETTAAGTNGPELKPTASGLNTDYPWTADSFSLDVRNFWFKVGEQLLFKTPGR